MWNVNYPLQSRLIEIYSRAEGIFNQRGKNGAYLEEIVGRGLMMYMDSTDPRDKIYAFLGLMHHSDRKGVLLQPDYSKPVVRVYGDAIRQMIQENEDDAAYNLTGAFADIKSSNFERETEDFPYWIPRWDNPSMLKDVRYRLASGLDHGWSASRSKVPEVRNIPDQEVLVLKGLKVAKVSRVFPLRRKSGDRDWLRRIGKEVSVLLDAGPWAETKELIFLKAIGGSYYRDFIENIENIEAAPVEGYKFLLEMVFMRCANEFDGEGNQIGEVDLQEDLDVYMNPRLSRTIMEVNLEACILLAYSFYQYPFSLFITEDNNLGYWCRKCKSWRYCLRPLWREAPFISSASWASMAILGAVLHEWCDAWRGYRGIRGGKTKRIVVRDLVKRA